MARSRGALRPLFALCASIFVLALLSGCYSYSQHVTLNRDGSGTIEVFVEHEQITLLGDPERIENRARAQCSDTEVDLEKNPGVQIVKCEDWIENYRVYEEATFSFANVSHLSTEMMSYSWERVGDYRELKVTYETGEDTPPTEAEKISARKDMAGYRGVTFSVTLPGPIAEAPGARVEGNTATWDYTWEKVIDEGMIRLEMRAKMKLGFWDRLLGS